MIISIIMPVYGVEKYIKAAIKSVLDQTFKDFELIIIDDNTPDKSMVIAKQFAARDHRIRLFKTSKNSGLGKARNFGIKKATGTHILFMDSDDTIPPNTLESYVNFVSKHNPEVVIAGYTDVFINTKGKIITECEIVPESEIYIDQEVKESFAKLDLSTVSRFVWNKLYSYEFLVKNNIEFEPIAPIEDVCFNIQVFDRAKKIITITLPLYNYHRRKKYKSLSNMFDLNLPDKYDERFERILNFQKKWEIKDQKILNMVYIVYFRILLSLIQKITNNKTMKNKEKNELILKAVLNHNTKYCIQEITNPSKTIKIFIFVLKTKKLFIVKSFAKIIYFVKEKFPTLYTKARKSN